MIQGGSTRGWELRSRVTGWALGCVVCVLLCSAAMLLFGTPRLTPGELWAMLFEGGGERVQRIVLLQLRLPRLALGLIAGAMLAVVGATLQAVFRNDLAGPELLGVSSGATLVVAVLVIFRIDLPWVVFPWLALLGGLLAGGTVIASGARSRGGQDLLLAGVAMSALLNGGVIGVISMGTQNDVGALYLFLVGSLAARTWEHVLVVLPWGLVGVPLLCLSGRVLNLLQLGDDVSSGLGLPALAVRALLMLISAGIVAAVVAVAGPISWIALLTPHLIRRGLGTTDARIVLPLAVLTGSALLVSADLLARLAFAPLELPVGLWTMVIGCPALLLLLRRQRLR